MEVTFRTTKLRKCYEEQAAAQRAWGEAVARAYGRRVEILKACETLHAVAAFRHLRLHPLAGDRKGEYAVTLHDRWRLIFTIHGAPVSRVRIEEVTVHYGD
jgi:proteic killer suppression protein